MQIHATVADLVEGDTPWLTAAPDNSGSLLRSASALVDQAIVGNSAGDPGALRDATCAQVAAWVTSGIDPASGGLGAAAPLRRKRIDTAELEYDTSLSASVTALQARRAIAEDLCPVAVAILEAADLIGAFAIADGGPCVAEATERPARDYGWY